MAKHKVETLGEDLTLYLAGFDSDSNERPFKPTPDSAVDTSSVSHIVRSQVEQYQDGFYIFYRASQSGTALDKTQRILEAALREDSFDFVLGGLYALRLLEDDSGIEAIMEKILEHVDSMNRGSGRTTLLQAIALEQDLIRQGIIEADSSTASGNCKILDLLTA
ncbi:MAG: hypothetical protein UT34_C0001G0487 [candidate division WS6 bacterium GW2011_GWF2_39_15]|uniref:Uncharacterized protein n=1 Tax=candidate division WS6 bacterium GW2011_GWF2_39_15 TaxID=1619100 RepID=A0A0G0N0S4_9BACT|nr:MAG: hypothetical protein UT34_C0001G0487 [candidate division WS6 bacterium GW2011_GWF2_39_15]